MKLERISPKQKKIFEFVTSNDTYLICDGAVRSGKTICMIAAFVIWAMAYQSDANFAICSKTVSNAERNVIAPLLGLEGFKNKCKYHRSEHYMECSINGRTNKFYIFGGKDESSYALIQGITVAGVLLDEVALMPRTFVEQAMARTLTYENRKIWFNCNPENQMHWFNQEWIVKADSGERNGITHLHFMMDDNPILSKKQIDEASEMFSGVFYHRYILGEWVMAEGLVYDMFDPEVHVVDDIDTEGEYFVSSDFGVQNANVFLLWRKAKGRDAWVCLNECYYSGRENKIQKTTKQLVNMLKGMLGGIMPKQIIVDPSASAMITELRHSGYHVLKANNDVQDGIAEVSSMIQQGRLLFKRSCRNTINEFGLYAWDENAANRGEDKPLKTNDHAMDAVRYFVKTKHLNNRKETQEYGYF